MRALASLLCLALVPGAAADTQRRVEISNPAQIATPEARQQLRYLASCALDENTLLSGVQDGQTFEFPGSMGLAPAWVDRPLTLSERRWVSACILARTNAFGAHVLISMRATASGHAALRASPEERESHTLYEGAFFGDIFSRTDPVAYVCVGPDHAADRPARERRKRICTDEVADGRPETRCGFISIGDCPKDGPPVADGRQWHEVIHVWLARAEQQE